MKGLLYFLNGCAVAALIASYLSGYISPATFWPFAFFGLAYPFLLLINLFFVLFWLVAWKKFAFVSLVTILAGYNHVIELVPARLKARETTSESGIRLVSYNVHSLYGNPVTRKVKKTRSLVTEFLASRDADIVCVQEFFAIGEDFNETLLKFATSIRLENFTFRNYQEFANKKKINAIATFSRYPILHEGYLGLPGQWNFAVFSDLLVGRDTIRLYNVHLQSIRFGQEDYSFYSHLTDPDREQPLLIGEGSKRMLWKLRKAFIQRASQVDLLKKHMASCTYPIILAGDFNDTPTSYTYNQLSAGLGDSFVECGSGLLNNTYAGQLPSFRIDYILHSNHFRATSYMRPRIDLSDHYPIMATLMRTSDK